MTVIITVLATLAAVLHIVFFYLESVAWARPTVHNLFGVRTPEDAAVMKPFAYNQGFYNLFLAIEVLLGVVLIGFGQTAVGFALAVFGLASMLAAAIVLLVSNRKLWKGAAVQGLLPLVALALYLVSLTAPDLA
jgi:putative membrane protein